MIYYRGFVIEYIDYRKDFRVYDPNYPQQTCAYVDSYREAKENIDYMYSRWDDNEEQ